MKRPGIVSLMPLVFMVGFVSTYSCGGGGSSSGGSEVYSHTITIDGANDFDGTADTFPTTSAGYTGYVSWDDTYLYIGMDGAEVGGGDSQVYLVAYISGGTATTQGYTYFNQEPVLPFAAAYHVYWRADEALAGAAAWNGASWVSAGWDFTGDWMSSGNFVEIRIPLADLGVTSPATVNVHLGMLRMTPAAEWTWAGVPSTSFTDGFDPDYGAYYAFAMGGETAPTGHTPQ